MKSEVLRQKWIDKDSVVNKAHLKEYDCDSEVF